MKKKIVPDNLRGLIQDVSEAFDKKANTLREKTVFADVRPSDAKTFMLIARHPRGLTELANAMNISRQAAHKSIQHLLSKGLITYELAEGSKRDKIAKLTKQGLEAQNVGHKIAAAIEQHAIDRVGEQDTMILKRLLMELR